MKKAHGATRCVSKKCENRILLPHEFFLPFEGRLNENNRWCRLTLLIPRGGLRRSTTSCFSYAKGSNVGFRSNGTWRLSFRKLGTSDRDTVEHITENPYLPYLKNNGLTKSQKGRYTPRKRTIDRSFKDTKQFRRYRYTRYRRRAKVMEQIIMTTV